MLDEYIIKASNRKDFEKKAKEYFVNMTGRIRTLHKTNYCSCGYSRFATEFITFTNMEEIATFEKTHMNSTPFRRCGNCFRNKK